jgi:hypothetical protein
MTPDQWRLFALIDGQLPLQALCQMLMAPADVVCLLAGELMAIGLVAPMTQNSGAYNDSSTSAREYGLPGMNNQSAPQAQAPYVVPMPNWTPQSTGGMTGPFGIPPAETQTQWGNANNATFMAGGGWVLSTRQPVAQPGANSARTQKIFLQ